MQICFITLQNVVKFSSLLQICLIFPFLSKVLLDLGDVYRPNRNYIHCNVSWRIFENDGGRGWQKSLTLIEKSLATEICSLSNFIHTVYINVHCPSKSVKICHLLLEILCGLIEFPVNKVSCLSQGKWQSGWWSILLNSFTFERVS